MIEMVKIFALFMIWPKQLKNHTRTYLYSPYKRVPLGILDKLSTVSSKSFHTKEDLSDNGEDFLDFLSKVLVELQITNTDLV